MAGEDSQPQIETESAQVLETPKVFDRNSARDAIFGARPNEEHATLNGVPIVLRDPSINEVLDAQHSEDRKMGMALMLVRYVRLPSGEALFEEADAPSLLEMPFNKDIQNIQNKIQKMVGSVVETEDKSEAKE